MPAPIEQPLLSVIVPAYNAEAFIAVTMDALINHLDAWPGVVELIVVNDGSSDRTSEHLAQATSRAPIEVHLLNNARNEGKGAAVRRGMQTARGQQRVFLDADLPYPPTEIAGICAALTAGADVAVACRVHRSSRYLVCPSLFRYQYARHVAGRLFNWLVRLALLPGIHDSQAGLKGFTAAAAERLFTDDLPPGFSFDVALLRRARQLGLRVDEVPVLYRHVGHATTMRFAADGLQMLRDLVQLRLHGTIHPETSTAGHAQDSSDTRRAPPLYRQE